MGQRGHAQPCRASGGMQDLRKHFLMEHQHNNAVLELCLLDSSTKPPPPRSWVQHPPVLPGRCWARAEAN